MRAALASLCAVAALPLATIDLGLGSERAGSGLAQQVAQVSEKKAAKGAASAATGALQPSPLKWIDVHMHLVPARGDFSGAVTAALRLMDEAGISFAVVMPTPQSPPGYNETQFVQLLKQHPRRFAWLGGGGDLNHMIHRTDPARVTEAIKREFTGKAEAILGAGARGFGEMAILHVVLTAGHPFEQTQADHPLYLALADVAGARGAVIDLHVDLVPADGPTPSRLVSLGNPATLRGNVEAFERLLAHNRKARFVLEHVGADPVGHARLDLIARLVATHPNLYLAIRAAPASGAGMLNTILGPDGILPEWRALLGKHADRFLYGTDTFMVAPGAKSGPGMVFAQRNVNKLALHNRILAGLAPEVARKIAVENPRRLFGIVP